MNMNNVASEISFPTYSDDDTSSLFDLYTMLQNYHSSQGDPIYAIHSREMSNPSSGELHAIDYLLGDILNGKFDDAISDYGDAGEVSDEDVDDYLVAESWQPTIQRMISEVEYTPNDEIYDEFAEVPPEMNPQATRTAKLAGMIKNRITGSFDDDKLAILQEVKSLCSDFELDFETQTQDEDHISVALVSRTEDVVGQITVDDGAAFGYTLSGGIGGPDGLDVDLFELVPSDEGMGAQRSVSTLHQVLEAVDAIAWGVYDSASLAGA